MRTRTKPKAAAGPLRGIRLIRPFRGELELVAAGYGARLPGRPTPTWESYVYGPAAVAEIHRILGDRCTDDVLAGIARTAGWAVTLFGVERDQEGTRAMRNAAKQLRRAARAVVRVDGDGTLVSAMRREGDRLDEVARWVTREPRKRSNLAAHEFAARMLAVFETVTGDTARVRKDSIPPYRLRGHWVEFLRAAMPPEIVADSVATDPTDEYARTAVRSRCRAS